MRRVLVSFLTIVLIFQSTGAFAAPTTWGRLKHLYVREPSLTLGPGVTAEEAARALDAVAAGSGTAPERVHVFRIPGETRPGPLVVLGRARTGEACVHLVSPSGTLLSGCALDLARGEARNAVTGARLWQATTSDPRRELEELLPGGFGEGFQRVVESVCKSFSFSIYLKCATATLNSPLGEAGCLALLILMYLACQGDLRVRMPPDSDCHGSRAAGGGLGTFCD